MTVTPAGVRDLPLATLVRFPGNARRGNVPEIRASVRRLGQYRTIVVRDTGSQMVILAGNHTADALAAEGHESARCEVITCTDDEARRVNLADNKLAEMGGYDGDALAELLSYLDDDYEGSGWSESEVERLINPELPDGFAEYDESTADGVNQDPEVTCPSCGHVFDPRASKVSD